MAEKDFRTPSPRELGARRGPSHPHPESNGFLPSLLPEAAAEHAEGLREAEADAVYRAIASLAADRDVLEVGCGGGRGAEALIGAGARTYVGTEAEDGLVERATRTHGGRGRFVTAVPEALPLASGSFGLVLCLSAIEQGADAEGVLAHLRRVLVPDGALVVSLPTAPRQDPVGGGLIGEFRRPEEWREALSQQFANVCLYRRRSSLAAAVLPAGGEPEELQRAAWLGADPGEERAILALASDAELPELEPTATLVGARDLRAYRETILAWEHRARRAEADGAAKHWELVASREAQRRLRKRLWHLEHTPIRKLFRLLRGKPARLSEGPPIRPPEAAPEQWD